jgi:hypothetical protein
MAKAPTDRYLSAGDLGRAAVKAASDELLSRAERSVAVGGAAPRDTDPVPEPPEPPAPPAPPAPTAEAAPTAAAPVPPERAAPDAEAPARRAGRPALAAALAVVVLAVGVAAVLLLGGGHKAATTTKPGAPPAAAKPPPAVANATTAVAARLLSAFNKGDDALAAELIRPGVVVNMIPSGYRRLATPGEIRTYLSRRLCALIPTIPPGQSGTFAVRGNTAYLTAAVRAGSRRPHHGQPCASTGTLIVTMVTGGGKVTQLLSGPIAAQAPTPVTPLPSAP